METKIIMKKYCSKCKNLISCIIEKNKDNPTTDKCGQFEQCKKCEGKTVGDRKSLSYYADNCVYHKIYSKKLWEKWVQSNNRLFKAQENLLNNLIKCKIDLHRLMLDWENVIKYWGAWNKKESDPLK